MPSLYGRALRRSLLINSHRLASRIFFSIQFAQHVMSCVLFAIFFFISTVDPFFFVPIVYYLVWLLVYRTNTNGDSFLKNNKRVVSLKRKKWFSLNQSLVHDS